VGPLEDTLRQLIRDEVRLVVRDEIQAALAAQEQHPRTSAENDNRSYVSVAAAARLAAVNERTIRRWIGNGDLTGYRAGRVLRVCPRELESYLARSPRECATRTEIRQRARSILATHGRRCA
jgi:excisionase family DNA binding protein